MINYRLKDNRNLNKLQDYIVPDLDLCKAILDRQLEFDNDYHWKKWGASYIQEKVKGHCPKKKARLHMDWIAGYLKDRKDLVNKVIKERSPARTEDNMGSVNQQSGNA